MTIGTSMSSIHVQMTQIPSLVFGATAPPTAPTLSPADILAYVQMRLGDIDGQMLGFKEYADKKQARLAQLREVQNALRNECTPGAGWNPSTPAMVDQSIKDIQGVIDGGKVKDPDLLAVLKGLQDEMKAKGSDPNGFPLPIGEQELNAKITSLGDQITSINSDNELTMMQLSQLMQSRGQIVQFSSNVLASLNETAKSILQKIG